MFENGISNKFCNKFSITFKIVSFGDYQTYSDFYIGYTKGESLESSIMDGYDQLGEGMNSSSSSSWGIGNRELCHSGDGDCYEQLKEITFSLNDLLRLEINFKEKKAKIYHNGKEEDCRKLRVNKLWIGLSIWFKGETVEMIEYIYD